MVKRRIQSSVNIAQTHSLPGADIGSDHELVIMTFRLKLKNMKKQGQTRIRFDLEHLRDPDVVEAYQVMIGGKFAPLLMLDAEDTDMDTMVDTFNTAVTDTANEILGKHRPVKQPWVTADILALCDKWRELKKEKKETEGAKQYRAISRDIKKSMKKAKETWIEKQCQGIEKKPWNEQQQESVPTGERPDQHKTGAKYHHPGHRWEVLTEDQDILKRWTEYYADLYNHRATGDPDVLNVPPVTDTDKYPILREEVEAAVKSPKKGKSPGIDNIPTELVQAWGEPMISILLTICNNIWQTGD